MGDTRSDPFALPEWQALHREASLVRQLIGSGATALGRASYGSGLGEYYTAFFGLSIGIERLAKLILIADYAIETLGRLPDQKSVKGFGHRLIELCEKANRISAARKLTLEFCRPDEPICWAVIDCLDAFADASRGRYANFEAIGNPGFDLDNEPVNRWWSKVVDPILDKHYRGKAGEALVRHRAAIMDELMGGFSKVLLVDEQGTMLQGVGVASERTGQTEWARKYGRFYTLLVVRWLSDIFDQLVHQAVYEKHVDALFGHQEFFLTYRVSSDLLRTRKQWPIK